MNYRVVFTPRARADVLAAFERLAERLGFPLREMLHGRRRNIFRIFFSIEENVICIHFIRHGAQDTLEL